MVGEDKYPHTEANNDARITVTNNDSSHRDNDTTVDEAGDPNDVVDTQKTLF